MSARRSATCLTYRRESRYRTVCQIRIPGAPQLALDPEAQAHGLPLQPTGLRRQSQLVATAPQPPVLDAAVEAEPHVARAVLVAERADTLRLPVVPAAQDPELRRRVTAQPVAQGRARLARGAERRPLATCAQ